MTHLLFVPSLCFSLAAVGDVLILSTHFSHNGVHVEDTAVIHLHNDRCVLDLALQLTKLLQNQQLMSNKVSACSNCCYSIVLYKNLYLQHHRRP